MERSLFCVKIFPPQRTDLAPAQASRYSSVEEIVPEFILSDDGHKSVQLCFGQDLHGSAVNFRWVNFCGRVTGDQVLLHCCFQSAVQSGVDAVDRSGGKAGGLSVSGTYPPGFLQGAVERPQVGGSDF